MTVNPFFQKIQSLLLYKKHYTGNKHLFQSFYACKIKKLSMTSHFSFFPLDYPQQKRKSPVKSLPPLVVLCTLYWAFCLLYLSCKRKKITRPHHQNGYSLILPVTVPYPLLSSGLSFSRLDKVSYTCVPQCFPKHIHAV